MGEGLYRSGIDVCFISYRSITDGFSYYMFTDIYFVFLALPILLILLKNISARTGKWVLIAAGLFLYMISAGWPGLILIVTVIVNWGLHTAITSDASARMEAAGFSDPSVPSASAASDETVGSSAKRKKPLLIVTVAFNVILLAAAKISGFMPLGISFFIFQMISVQIDAGDERLPFEDFLIMTMFFPKLIMGPIVRYADIKEHLRVWLGRKLVTWNGLEEGLKLYTAGLFLKVVLADNLATLWNTVMVAGVYGLSTPTSWLGAICYTLELYFDFWGYSLMAMACGTMFGIPLARNFNEPYRSKSVGEFWRRWHITLGTWFKDYVYIPLGGNRKGKLRTLFNLFIVWLLTGLWHGITPNFIIWGMFLFIFIALEKFTLLGKVSETKVISHIYLIVIIVISWVIFAINDVKDLWIYIKCMFGIYHPESAPSMQQFVRLLRTYWYLIAGGILFITPVPRALYKLLSEKKAGMALLLVMLGVSAFFMLQGRNNVFMYYSF